MTQFEKEGLNFPMLPSHNSLSVEYYILKQHYTTKDIRNKQNRRIITRRKVGNSTGRIHNT